MNPLEDANDAADFLKKYGNETPAEFIQPQIATAMWDSIERLSILSIANSLNSLAESFKTIADTAGGISAPDLESIIEGVRKAMD